MIRVLQALENKVFKEKLRHKLPKNALKTPDISGKYPSSLLDKLPRTYIDLGILSEYLLKQNNVNVDLLKSSILYLFNVVISDDILNSNSTAYYIESIKETKNLITNITQETLQFDRELTLGHIAGHPDILTQSHIFEIKASCRLKDSWTHFLLQTFCYAALAPFAKHVHIVLPLQRYIWSFELNNWKSKADFLNIIKDYEPPTEDNSIAAMFLRIEYSIGSHIGKHGKLSTTINKLTSNMPFQIFISMNVSNLNIPEDDIKITKQIVESKKLRIYVHCPYVLNICDDQDYIANTIVKLMKITHSCGFIGLVLHVGKYVKRKEEDALKIMFENISKVLEKCATDCCFLILETPAGQGTEVLTNPKAFLDFCKSIKHPNLKICIDTCHVFAAGHYPHEYIEYVRDNAKEYLQLIHFNDSETDFNSRVDRHAIIGRGKIPYDFLIRSAQIARELKIDMLTE